MTSFDVPIEDVDVCLIVYNEAQFIEQCLLALKPRFRRVCVLDMRSQDRTVEIVRDVYGDSATIATQPRAELFRSGFAAARNTVTAMARSKWALHVDADEILAPFDGDSIAFESPIAAAKIARRNLLGDPPERWAPDAFAGYATSSVEHHVRLYQPSPDMRWESFLHEEVWAGERRAEEMAGVAGLTLEHVSHFRPFADKEEKEDFYAWILMRVQQNPELQTHMRAFYTREFIPQNAERFAGMAARFAARHGL